MLASVLVVAASICANSAETDLLAKLPSVFDKAAANYRVLESAAAKRIGETDKKGALLTPHGFKRATGELDMRSIYWWTSGHFAGSLWYLYEATDDAFFRDRAKVWTERLAPNAEVDTNHDLGFIMYCSFGNARRLMKTDAYDALIVRTAETLSLRFNPSLGLIRSWGKRDQKKDFLVIPDNLMNLELLEAAAQLGRRASCPSRSGAGACDGRDAHRPSVGTCDGRDAHRPSAGDRFDEIARSHADVTMRHHFRADGGTYHVLDYDQATGRVQGIKRGQGASCETAWSRGQSWAIYGYAMMYRFTKDRRYLGFAQKLADYAIGHVNMPADGIPFWDYGAPGEERDSSAGSIMASGLLELSTFVGGEKGATYRAFAVKQLLSLASDDYFAKPDELGGFILRHGVGHKPANSEVDTPLDYGDYYFLEGLLRFRNLVKGK